MLCVVIGLPHYWEWDCFPFPVLAPNHSGINRRSTDEWVTAFPECVTCPLSVCILDDFKAAALENQRVICILDVCPLDNDKTEVFLRKIYKITEVDVVNQT